MACAVLFLLLVMAVGAALLFALRALRHWHGERAGRAYELPVDRRGTLWRAGVSGAATLAAVGLAVPLLNGPGFRAGFGTGPAAGPASARPVAARHDLAPPPAPTVRAPSASASPVSEARTLGHPAHGTLQLLRDGTRVWLPPHYSSPSALGVAYPVALVHATAADDLGLYAAFAAQVARGQADAFLLVTPPTCASDAGAVLAEVGSRYRALNVRTARGLVGVGPLALCAIREALADRSRYGAAAGVSGTYPGLAAPVGPYPALLLAVGADQPGARASADRLRTALHPRGDHVRLLDGAADHDALFRDVATYLTEKLDGPSRTSHPPRTPPASAPSRAMRPRTSPLPPHRPGTAGHTPTAHIRPDHPATSAHPAPVTGGAHSGPASHTATSPHAPSRAARQPAAHTPARTPARTHAPTAAARPPARAPSHSHTTNHPSPTTAKPSSSHPLNRSPNRSAPRSPAHSAPRSPTHSATHSSADSSHRSANPAAHSAPDLASAHTPAIRSLIRSIPTFHPVTPKNQL
ncbi:hypothetical protein [Actinacidiphila yeochonensis]|uniref:hypothetical protein n=1 Tax=Actinacidiphila yeochonensis TaxID=89050 RepID=UPI000AB7301B|nr:hypothetical protein [Actinacidiphila yeochonensis]